MKVFKRTSQKGFTLIEMLVVAPIVILTIGAFLTVIISMTGEVLASRASNNLSYNVQDALDHIEQDVKMSNSFMATNNVLGTNQGYNDDTTAFTNVGGTSGTSLILNAVATTTNPVSASSSYVYLINKPNACATAAGNNIPFTYNIVYFVKNNNLYRRTIMPTTYTDTTNTVCSIPWQQPSCSPTYMDAQSGSVFCKTKDVELVDGVTPGNFSLQYYNGESSTTVNTPASSTSASAADRNTALLSATTVGVSIDAQQTSAGRPIERVAVLRASRLDQNASAIATVTADGVPAAPNVSSSTGEPTTAIFSWPKVTTATGYTFQYKINSGSWTTGFTNQPTQTYTVTTATHNDVVNARVTAINSAGSSGYGTSTVTIPQWTPFTLQNSWIDYGPPFMNTGYTKTTAGVVMLKGLIRAGSTASGAVIANLPAGYRPSSALLFTVTANTATGRILIDSNGDITNYGSAGASAAYTTLDGVSFIPSGSPYTLTGLTMLNSWVNFGTGYSNLVSTTDGAGRVNVQGNIKNGSTSPTYMARIADGSTVPTGDARYFPIPTSAGTFGYSVLDASGGIIYETGGNSLQSLNFKFYPSSRTNGTNCTTSWCVLPLSNSWVAYDAARTPSYTIGSDGVVSLRGLARNGTIANDTVMGTLPTGYRPASRIVTTNMCTAAYCRMDVMPNGTILAETGVSNGYASLDNIQFMINE